MKKTILVLLLGILLAAILMPTLAFASPSSTTSSTFQSKVARINKTPFQKVTVGDALLHDPLGF